MRLLCWFDAVQGDSLARASGVWSENPWEKKTETTDMEQVL